MGVDVASVRALHVRISVHFRDGIKRALCIDTVDSFEDLAVFMERYRVDMAVIDHEPDGRSARALAKRFPNRVYLVSYGARHQLDPIKVDEDRWQVSARRLDVIDETLDAIRRGLNELPLNLPESYTDHLQALVRYSEQDDRGRLKIGYLKTSDDDFAQAEIYDVVALHVWSHLRIRNELQREEYVRLDELVPVERSDLDHYGVPEYSPGPPEPSLAKLMGLEDIEADRDALEFEVDGWQY